MPIEHVPGADLSYYLIAYDGDGQERGDDPDGRMSARAVAALRDAETPVSDVFLMSHGWRADVPSAKRQYAAWIGAMLACRDDLARMKSTRPGFHPLLIGLHWPSEPFGEEDLAASGVSFGLDAMDSAPFVDRYAERLVETPAARAALHTIAAAMRDNPAPRTLPAAVQDAYATLARETGLAPEATGATPGEDGEPFDAEAIYETARAEPVSFGDTRIDDFLLLPLRLLSYRTMKARAKLIGEGGGARLLAALQQAAGLERDTRFHLMGHSFGCIVVTSIVAGTGNEVAATGPVHSLVLVQGAMSIWSLAARIPALPNRAGAFHRIIQEGRVAGPILTTMSRFDSAVADHYPRVSWAGGWVPGASDQVSFDLGKQEWPKYAAIGSLGLRGDGLSIHDLDLQSVTEPYDFTPGAIYNLQSEHIIREGPPPSGAHGDFLKPEVGHAVWQAARG